MRVLILAVVALAGCEPQPVDRGGRLLDYTAEVEAHNAHVRPGDVTPLRGICLSACTLRLAETDICVADDAVFGFHAPRWLGQPLYGTPDPALKAWYLMLFRQNRPVGAQYLDRSQFIDRFKLSYLRGAQVSAAFEIPECTSAALAVGDKSPS